MFSGAVNACMDGAEQNQKGGRRARLPGHMNFVFSQRDTDTGQGFIFSRDDVAMQYYIYI
jgi:hypothetical protein